MKKIRSLCMTVTVYAIAYAVMQIPSRSYAQPGANPDKSLVEKSGSRDTCQMLLAAKKAQLTPEKGDPSEGTKTSALTGSRLDSLAHHMVEESVSEMSEQARISLEKSINEFIARNLAQDRLNIDTLKTTRLGKSTF